MSTPPSLGDVLTNLVNAVVTIVSEIVNAIASNASTIATLVFMGVLMAVVWRYGSRVIRGLTGIFRGLAF